MKLEQERLPEAAFATAPQHAAQGGAQPRMMNPEGIKQEVETLVAMNALPDGFSLESAMRDPAFIQLLVEMPAQYAVRVYQAEARAHSAGEEALQTLTARLRAREGLPQAARADAAGLPVRDYRNMSTEEFLALERKFKEQSQKGIRAKL